MLQQPLRYSHLSFSETCRFRRVVRHGFRERLANLLPVTNRRRSRTRKMINKNGKPLKKTAGNAHVKPNKLNGLDRPKRGSASLTVPKGCRPNEREISKNGTRHAELPDVLLESAQLIGAEPVPKRPTVGQINVGKPHVILAPVAGKEMSGEMPDEMPPQCVVIRDGCGRVFDALFVVEGSVELWLSGLQ
ncbi:MAG: hypothetical protein AAFO98_00305 [Pseudomonadota bacterium]